MNQVIEWVPAAFRCKRPLWWILHIEHAAKVAPGEIFGVL
jgi:hypothetical protein